MLLVVWAETTVVRAAIMDFRAVRQRNRAGLIEFSKCRVGFRVSIDKCFERSTLRAAFAHVNFVIAQNDLRIDDSSALGTDAAGQLVEDVIGILFPWCNGVCRALRSNTIEVLHG